MGRTSEEVEIKLAAASPAAARRLLSANGFRVSRKRIFEANDVWDTPENSLRSRRTLLRLRQAGTRHVLTYKGTPVEGRHKRREELEIELPESRIIAQILERIGFHRQFRYEKYRTEYQAPGEKGIATVDETPIGTFVELEGGARWIDRTAKRLGFQPGDYITKSYGTLYLEHCAGKGIQPSHMVFRRGQ